MAIQRKAFTFDANLQLKDAGLVAASAAAQVGGADKILDLGAGRVDGRVIIDISAIETGSGDEKYDLWVQFSNSATFASGIVAGPMTREGVATSPVSAATTAGRREVKFTNEIDGVTYRYMRLYTVVAGTIATGINYTAFVAKLG